MLTPATTYTGCVILGHEELGLVTTAGRRGDMAVVNTTRGITYICSCAEPHPQQGAVELPSDVEPEVG